MTKRDCSPKGPYGLVRAAAASTSVSTVDLLLELFDNGIDAGANVIEAEVMGSGKKAGHGTFRLTDNGRGVDCVETLLTPGESTQEETGQQAMGRWGIGAKDCIFTVGGPSSSLDIESRTKTVAWTCSIAWAKQDTWGYDQNDCEPEDLELIGATGLRLTLSRCNRVMPTPKALRDAVALAYWPWLDFAGNTIKVNGEKVESPKPPPTDGRFRGTEVIVDTARRLTIDGGALKGEHSLAGVTVFHGNRAIYVTSGFGTGDYSHAGIFVVVRLHGQWGLERNKRGLTEGDKDLLREALELALDGLLKETAERMRKLDVTGLLDDVNERFAGIQLEVGMAKRPGKPRTKRDPPEPTEPKDRPVREATVVAGEGDVTQKRKAKKTKPYRIVIVPGDKESIGKVDIENRQVILYSSNESIATLLHEKDPRGVLIVASGMLCHQLDKGGDGVLPFPDAYGRMLHLILLGRASELVD